MRLGAPQGPTVTMPKPTQVPSRPVSVRARVASKPRLTSDSRPIAPNAGKTIPV